MNAQNAKNIINNPILKMSVLDTCIREGKILDRDYSFAQSLVNQFYSKRDLSPKQWPWVDKLLDGVKERNAAKAARDAAAIDLAKLQALFNQAAEGLKRPRVAFKVENVGEFRVAPAGATSRNPGHLYVKDVSGEYLGKIDPQGRLHMAYHARDSHGDVFQALTEFAEDPSAKAAAYGKETGICCFCCRELTDDRSVSVGYGPICADNWGLPWGA